MKKRYQIDQQRAVQQFRRLLQEGVGNLLRHAGLELMHLVMDEEVKSLAGERHQQHEQRRAQGIVTRTGRNSGIGGSVSASE
jgi:hypothetical protein